MSEEKNKNKTENFQDQDIHEALERINELEQKLEESEKEKQDYLEGWKRAKADFVNYTKEEAAKFGKMAAYAQEKAIEDILPILDNLELSEKNIQNTEDEFVKGIAQIKKQIQDLLTSYGAEEIKCGDGKFNPALHDAISEKKEEGRESGQIIRVIRKGYKIGDRVIRPAQVVINN